MSSVPDAAEFAARHKAFSRERAIVAFVGYAPLIVLYLLTHSSWMKQRLPESKDMAALYIVVLPLLWFGVVTLLYRWVGPRRHRLRCPACNHPLVAGDFKRAMQHGQCTSCGSAVVELDPVPTSSRQP